MSPEIPSCQFEMATKPRTGTYKILYASQRIKVEGKVCKLDRNLPVYAEKIENGYVLTVTTSKESVRDVNGDLIVVESEDSRYSKEFRLEEKISKYMFALK